MKRKMIQDENEFYICKHCNKKRDSSDFYKNYIEKKRLICKFCERKNILKYRGEPNSMTRVLENLKSNARKNKLKGFEHWNIFEVERVLKKFGHDKTDLRYISIVVNDKDKPFTPDNCKIRIKNNPKK